MQTRTIIISAGVHAFIGWSLLQASEQKRARPMTSVAVVTEKKPEPKKEKPPEPKPPPPAPKPPPHAAAIVAAAPPPPAAAPPPSTPRAAAAPSGPSLNSGLSMSNDGPGLSVGAAHPGPASAKPQPVAKAEPVKKEAPPAESECTEAPTKPEPIFKPDIEYTEASRAAGVEGRLVLRVTIGADGAVSSVDVVSGVDPALDASAVATVQKWRFKPSQRCGKAVDGGVYTLARRFELGD